jgi:hypothetical protein
LVRNKLQIKVGRYGGISVKTLDLNHGSLWCKAFGWESSDIGWQEMRNDAGP